MDEVFQLNPGLGTMEADALCLSNHSVDLEIYFEIIYLVYIMHIWVFSRGLKVFI